MISRPSKDVSITYATQGGFPILYLMKDSFYYHFISIISCCGPYFSQGIHRISSFRRAKSMQLIACDFSSPSYLPTAVDSEVNRRGQMDRQANGMLP